MKKPRPKRASAQLKVAWLGKGGAGIRTQIFLTLNPKEVISATVALTDVSCLLTDDYA